MIAVVTYLWGAKHYTPAHVQQLARSVAHFLPIPHRFVCIADRPVAGVKTIGNPVPQFPKRCYRRLWLFSEQAKRLGDGILHLDLDLVICGPLEPFICPGVGLRIYRAGSVAAKGYSLNPSVLWLTPGTQTDIWTAFNRAPNVLAQRANDAGFWGSDQAVISHLREAQDVPTFGPEDGVVSYRHIRHEALTEPPPGTRIVSFHGKRSPFEPAIQAAHPWIPAAWKEAA